MRIEVLGHAAHGATPWLGENAILRAYEVFRELESLPFASRSSELFDRPSINLGRILGGDALNKVPDTCFIDVDVRYLPEQDPDEILAEVARAVRRPGGLDVLAARRSWSIPTRHTCRALRASAAPHSDGQAKGVVGRDGASDAVSFLRVGIPAVEFGPSGGGHHGPEEWVSIPSLAGYRQAIVDFVTRPPRRARRGAGDDSEAGGG